MSFKTKTILVLFVFFLSDLSHGQKDKKFFRKDYKYLETVDGFYKFHSTLRPWADARRLCALEGASLFYPETSDEANAVLSFWNSTKPSITTVSVGMSELMTEGVYETIDGKFVSELYNNWKIGQPDNYRGKEHCGCMVRGEMYDCDCLQKLAFICKKSHQSLEWNYNCNTPNLDYSFNADIGKCYKLHTVPLTWTDAYAACRAEQSYLALSNNQLEADYLVNLTVSALDKRVGGNYFRGIYHMGFHNKLHAGWQTIRGIPMNVDADAWWDNREPIIDEHDQCGSMFFNGRLNTVSCDTKSFFICEHDVNSSSLLQETNFA